MLGATSKRALVSALVSIPTACLAFGIADKASIPNWMRLVISPGVLIGFRFISPQPCGGLLDCLVQVMDGYARCAQLTCVVNAVLYGLLIFGIVTTVSASRRNAH
jgi:hypothetical protein